MMRGRISAMRRALRPLAAVCAFVFLIPATARDAAAEAPLALCPDCGSEIAAGMATCPHCGVAVPAETTAGDSADGQEDAGEGEVPEGPSPGAPAAARDIAEARRRSRKGDLAAALVLFRNAQALLAAGAGAAPPPDAVRAVAAEATAAEREFAAEVKQASRATAMARAARAVETFMRGEGRIPLGRAWVPADWPTTLAPAAIAAVRLSLPPRCANCGGFGAIPCRACGGKGAVPCDAKGCDNGWTYRRPSESLKGAGLSTREKCGKCAGSGTMPCKACQGRGTTPCRKCGESGNAPLCRGCGGTGLENCRECMRQGVRADCPLCRGTGKAICGKCGGDGRTAH